MTSSNVWSLGTLFHGNGHPGWFDQNGRHVSAKTGFAYCVLNRIDWYTWYPTVEELDYLAENPE